MQHRVGALLLAAHVVGPQAAPGGKDVLVGHPVPGQTAADGGGQPHRPHHQLGRDGLLVLGQTGV